MSGNSPSLPPRPFAPGRRLASLKDCRRELAKLYRAAARGDVPSKIATRLAYMLIGLAKMIEADAIESRLEAVEQELRRRQLSGPQALTFDAGDYGDEQPEKPLSPRR